MTRKKTNLAKRILSAALALIFFTGETVLAAPGSPVKIEANQALSKDGLLLAADFRVPGHLGTVGETHIAPPGARDEKRRTTSG